MKKILCLSIICLILSPCSFASSHPHPSKNAVYHNHSNHSSGSSSTPVYLIKKDIRQDEIKFQDCNEHYAITETITDYYSDNTKITYTKSNVYKSDGTILLSDCRKVEHIVYNDNHYFIAYNKNGAILYDNNAHPITIRKYSKIEKTDTDENRLLVKYNKKYGIIDLEENTIVPIKYQKLEKIGHNKFITKLNRYYGIIDINNNIILNSDCDKIKPLYDTYVIKKFNKFGLYDINANKILDINYDKIDKLGEYIIVKKSNKYRVFDYTGKPVSLKTYEKVRLKRNHLQGLNNENRWIDIN